MNKWFVCIAIMLAMALSTPVSATESPVEMVRETAKQVLELLKKEDGKNTAKLREQIEILVTPKFDFKRMTALALGKNWRAATTEQQEELALQFQVLLTKTYASAMTRFKHAQVEVHPTASISNNGLEAVVHSTITLPHNSEKKSVTVDYTLYKTPPGWKVYNINIEGASLVTVYRNQFDADIRVDGIEGLIKSLKTKNHWLSQQ